MRAVVLHGYGEPDVLKFEDRPEPVSRDTDIRVEVHATSVNPVDTKVRKTGGGAARASSSPRRKPFICAPASSPGKRF